MGKAYGIDLRRRVVGFVERGGTLADAAERYEVGYATVVRWLRRHRESGSLDPSRIGHPPGSKLDVHEAFLLSLFEQEADLTLEDVRERLKAEYGVEAGMGTVWRFYRSRGISFKKKPVRL
jgi:transposase